MGDNVIRRIMTPGESREHFRATEKTEISLVRGGKLAYLWIGNAEQPQWCYATLSGATNLRKLAEAILRELDRDGA